MHGPVHKLSNHLDKVVQANPCAILGLLVKFTVGIRNLTSALGHS